MSWEISTVCKREGPKHKISPLDQENIFKTEVDKICRKPGTRKSLKSFEISGDSR